MASLQELVPASFRGVHFLVPHGTVESGRHQVKHEYPDSNTRFVEDNGLRVPDYKVNAIVHGADALSRMRRLEAALTAVGPGTLVHPLHGRKFCQVGPYHLKHTDERVGVYEFEIEFFVTGPPVFPGLLSGIAAAITGLSALAIVALFNAFQAQFSVPFTIAGRTLAVVTNAVSLVTSTMTATFGSVAGVRLAAATIARAPEMLTQDAAAMATQLSTLMRAPFDDLNVSQPELWRGYSGLSGIARSITADAAAIAPTTSDLAVRKHCMTCLGTLIQTIAFVSMCEAAAGKSYQTAEQVAEDIAAIVAAHEATMDLALLTECRNNLAHVMSETIAVLQKAQVNLPSITSLKVYEMPASVMAYLLYDGDDNLSVLVGMNDGKNPVLYDGSVKVLRSA